MKVQLPNSSSSLSLVKGLIRGSRVNDLAVCCGPQPGIKWPNHVHPVSTGPLKQQLFGKHWFKLSVSR